MIIKGTVHRFRIDSSGLECLAKIYFSESIGMTNCYILLDREEPSCSEQLSVLAYIEDEQPILLSVGKTYMFRISIEFASDLTKVGNDESIGFSQPMEETQYTVFTTRFIERVDSRTIICDMGNLCNRIAVNFYSDVIDVYANDVVRFIGEIGVIPLFEQRGGEPQPL